MIIRGSLELCSLATVGTQELMVIRVYFKHIISMNCPYNFSYNS